jgi:hypothetical protein
MRRNLGIDRYKDSGAPNSLWHRLGADRVYRRQENTLRIIGVACWHHRPGTKQIRSPCSAREKS